MNEDREELRKRLHKELSKKYSEDYPEDEDRHVGDEKKVQPDPLPLLIQQLQMILEENTEQTRILKEIRARLEEHPDFLD